MNTGTSFPVHALESIDSLTSLQDFLTKHPQLQILDAVESLHAEILSGIVVDAARAQRLSKVVRWLAEVAQDEYALRSHGRNPFFGDVRAPGAPRYLAGGSS